MRSTLFVPTAALAVAALALTGCSPGAPIEPVTLTLAHVDGGPELDPAVGWFVDRVAELSDGAITIEVAYGCCGDTVDVEELLVASVADGSADLGWFGTRVLGDLGVTAAAALTAPLLVDSYELQAAVLGSSAVTTALGAIAALGVDPIAFAPGTLRRPLASTGPVLSVADWKGATVASFHSAQNAEAFTALGA
ncbi:MAG: hypothetical protein Q8M65_02430, partial [Rhodoglobus sp.]|nr:hypothetical protein [Rhodoglobus sp.]